MPNSYIIIEWNGIEYISLMLNEDGEPIIFNTEEDAQTYADEQCSLNYKIIKIY